MMVNALNAERIKLLSTKSPYWCVAIVALLAILFSVLIGAFASGDDSENIYASDYTTGVSQIGVIVLMIMAVLVVTSEFRFGTIRTTYQAIPRREVVLGAKAVIYGGLSVIVTLVLGIVALLLGKALSGNNMNLVGSDAIRQYWGIPVYTLLCILIGLGIGAIVRQTAGAIVVLLIWTLALEGIIGIIPKFGDAVSPYLPFNNAARFLTERDTSIDFPWNAYGSIAYFAVISLIIFGIGVLVTNRRDA